jgi:serine/threonine-protein kinase
VEAAAAAEAGPIEHRARELDAKRPAVGAEAKRIARRALELDATRPEGRVALGTIHLADGEGAKAAIEIAGALRVAPSSVYAIDTMGRLLVEAGAAEEGLRLLDIALSKEDISLARHARIRTKVLLGDWDNVPDWMSELPPGTGDSLASALLWLRFLTWSVKAERAKTIMGAIFQLELNADMRARLSPLAPDPTSAEARATVRALMEFVAGRMPQRGARGRALAKQLLVEGAFYANDPSSGLAALRAADEASPFDLLWLDRCNLFDSVRAHPDFPSVRASVAVRAEAVVSAYERAKISSRVRG